jgi:hypothetical protein
MTGLLGLGWVELNQGGMCLVGAGAGNWVPSPIFQRLKISNKIVNFVMGSTIWNSLRTGHKKIKIYYRGKKFYNVRPWNFYQENELLQKQAFKRFKKTLHKIFACLHRKVLTFQIPTKCNKVYRLNDFFEFY